MNLSFKWLVLSVDHCLCINITMCTHHWALCTFVLESRYEGICKLYNMVGTAYIKPHTTCYVYIQVCYIVLRWCAEQFCTMKMYYLQRKKNSFFSRNFQLCMNFQKLRLKKNEINNPCCSFNCQTTNDIKALFNEWRFNKFTIS